MVDSRGGGMAEHSDSDLGDRLHVQLCAPRLKSYPLHTRIRARCSPRSSGILSLKHSTKLEYLKQDFIDLIQATFADTVYYQDRAFVVEFYADW